MCAERIQRLLMAIVLGVALLLFLNSYILYGAILQSFVILMIISWSIFDFCPSIWIFSKFTSSCEKK